jgi:hypothetical protein
MKKISKFLQASETRHIPSAAKVITKLTPEGNPKNINITIVEEFSAPPMVTHDILHIEKNLLENIDNFIKDNKKEINFSNVSVDKYVHMEGHQGKIYFSCSFSLSVKDVNEGKKLLQLDSDLSFYKNRKEPL